MPPRSKITQLPKSVREWIEKQIIEQDFSGYDLLAEMIRSEGVDVSKSGLQRHGAMIEKRLAAVKASTEVAERIANAAPDDQDNRSAAVMSLLQSGFLEAIVKMQDAEQESSDPVKYLRMLNGAAVAMAQLTNASVGQKRWMIEMRNKLKAAADDVAATAKKAGLDDSAIDVIKRRILGIAESSKPSA